MPWQLGGTVPGTYTRSDLEAAAAALQAAATSYALPQLGRLADELAAAAGGMTDDDTAMILYVTGNTPYVSVTSSEMRPARPVQLTDHPFSTLMRIITEGL
jgi:hypothetical protein